MNLKEILEYRRSVRIYDQQQSLDTDKVKNCLELATLAPNSSNMQLWEFYHITDPVIITKMVEPCMGQQTVSTASQLVVFITRQNLYKKRIQSILKFEEENIKDNSPADKQEKRIKNIRFYYGRMIPFLYARFFGILGILRIILVKIIGIFRPVMREVSENDMKVVIHKTCGLAAQTFMIAMANEKYDTCPLEGFDSKRVKKLLNLPPSSEINMIVSCGIRKENMGIWGERFRIPFEEVYHRI